MIKYRIEIHDLGIVVINSIPIYDLVELSKFAKKRYKYDILDGLLASKLNASVVFTNKRNSEEWRNILHIKDSDNPCQMIHSYDETI